MSGPFDYDSQAERDALALLEAGRARYPGLFVWIYDVDDGLISFKPLDTFEVDGIEYNRANAHNVCRLLAQLADVPHDCSEYDSCGFDWGIDYTDKTRDVQESRGDGYRWKPGMVYYKSTEFETPIYGG